jgi:hypothetical protein
VTTAGYGAAGVVGAEAITVTVPNRRDCRVLRVTSAERLASSGYRLVDPCWLTGGPSPLCQSWGRLCGGGGANTKRRAQHFSKRRGSG